MSIYAIADLHLSMAPQTEKPMDVFGSRWADHVGRIKKNWCKTINGNDTVVIAGDISWGLKLEDAVYDLDWINMLPGHKVVIKGNHDLWWSGITRLNTMYDSITFLQNSAYYVCSKTDKLKGVWICGTRGWITPDDDNFFDSDEKIYKREIMRLKASLDAAPDGTEILGFLHYPPVSDPHKFSGFMQLFEDYGVKKVYYGHVHGEANFNSSIQGNYHGIEYKLISADYLNCIPIKIHE